MQSGTHQYTYIMEDIVTFLLFLTMFTFDRVCALLQNIFRTLASFFM